MNPSENRNIYSTHKKLSNKSRSARNQLQGARYRLLTWHTILVAEEEAGA